MRHRVLTVSLQRLLIAGAQPNINVLWEGRFVLGFNLPEVRVHHVLSRTWSHVLHAFPQLVCDLGPKQVVCAVAPRFELGHGVPPISVPFVAVLGPGHGSELTDTVAPRLIIWVWRVYLHRLTQLKLPDRVIEALPEVLGGDVAVDVIPAWAAVRLVHALFVHVGDGVGPIFFRGVNHWHHWFETF